MLALIAPEDIRHSDTYFPLLKQYGYEIKSCSKPEVFRDILKQNPDLIISPACIENESFLDDISRHPDAKWILQEKMSWAGAAKLFKETGCTDVLLEIPSASNLFEVLNASKEAKETEGTSAHYRWLKSVFVNLQIQNVNVLQDELNEELPDNNTDGASHLRQLENLFFSPALNGTLSKIHFGSILNHIFTDKMTGTLHLWRQSMHWSILFQDGLPLDMAVYDKTKFFSLETWSECHPQYQGIFSSVKDLKSTREKLQKIQNSESIHHAWMKSLILEIFSWPEADFVWKDQIISTVPESFSTLTTEEMLKIFEEGILEWTPEAIILEVTQSCLPYFLKIKDNQERLDSVLSVPAKSVAEKLKKGDTLSEILATFSVDNPVHQVVYLFLMMRHLDLNA